MTHHHFKTLDEKAMSKLKRLEGKMGKCLVACEAEPRLTEVSSAELKEMQAAEKEMNAILVAYACPVDAL